MNLVRRCPHCNSTDIGDVRCYGERGHGGFTWVAGCETCGRVLRHFDVVDSDTGELIATAPSDGDHKPVEWHKEFEVDHANLGGRDEEGMAL